MLIPSPRPYWPRITRRSRENRGRMARVTVEDCILQVPNRFELVMYAAQRARDISGGSQIMIDRDREKNPVVARREISDVNLDQETLKNKLISAMQKHADINKPEEVNEMAELEQ